jgi:hypothetical protein
MALAVSLDFSLQRICSDMLTFTPGETSSVQKAQPFGGSERWGRQLGPHLSLQPIELGNLEGWAIG